MKRKVKKEFEIIIDKLFQDRDHALIDIKNLTVREFSIISYVLRSYCERYGADGPDDSVGITIIILSLFFDDIEKEIDETLLNVAKGAYHG